MGFGSDFWGSVAYSALSPDVDRFGPIQAFEASSFYGDDSFVL